MRLVIERAKKKKGGKSESGQHVYSPYSLTAYRISIILIHLHSSPLGNTSLTCDYTNSLLFVHSTIPLCSMSVYMLFKGLFFPSYV